MLVKFIEKKQVAKNTYSFFFETSEKFRFNPGQFIELTLPILKSENTHWFSLSSSPTEELIAITTKISNNASTYKNELNNLKINEKVIMSSPMGDFVLPKNINKPLFFVAIGIGVTPFRSMIKYLADTREQRQISLLYSIKDIEYLAFEEVLSTQKNYQKIIQNPPKNWQGLSGRLTAKKIFKMLNNQNETIFLSGPETLVEKLTKDLIAMGVDQNMIQTDYFLGYGDE